MSLVGFKAQNHQQQTGKRGALDKVDDRRTPDSIWQPLDNEFRFTLDVAASPDNAKCAQFLTLEDDGLARHWEGSVWCNPPYSDCGAWVQKANYERAWCDSIVMLLPNNRCEQKWWQESVEPYRREGIIETRFLPGRPRFDVPAGTYSDPRGNRPPFGCVVLIWRRAANGSGFDEQHVRNLRLLGLIRDDPAWALSRVLLAERLERVLSRAANSHPVNRP